MQDLNITLECKREIEAILKETQKRYENGEIKSNSLDEFLENRRRKKGRNIAMGGNAGEVKFSRKF